MPDDETAVTPSVKSIAVAQEEVVPGTFDRDRLLEVLCCLDDGDQDEQQRSFAELVKALDENRPDGQKLFPDR